MPANWQDIPHGAIQSNDQSWKGMKKNAHSRRPVQQSHLTLRFISA